MIDSYLEQEEHIVGLRRKLAKVDPTSDDARLTVYNLGQVYEILRHKWFLSERAGYDVGYAFAAEDYVTSGYNVGFREKFKDYLQANFPVLSILIRQANSPEVVHGVCGDYKPKKTEKLDLAPAA